ncbi:hypothetical protein ACIP93_33640 [Streptomyces sp. NPDC088745]|uniref:hypothetical protein n=1 Tax=Streptomyces sp. NPDC088745 TaxID=3365884 RepID=UPI0038172AAC
MPQTPNPTTYRVSWYSDFEASSPLEAAQQAYEQLQSYAERDTWPPVLDVTDEAGGATVVIDLNERGADA